MELSIKFRNYVSYPKWTTIFRYQSHLLTIRVKTHKRAGEVCPVLELWFVLPLWELPKDWNTPLPYHKVVIVYSLNLPHLTMGLGC